MLKKLIFVNVLILSVLLLTSCGAAINVEVPAALGSVTVPPISVVIGNPTPAPVTAAPVTTAPAQGILGNSLLLYIVIGLVIVIALIAIVAVASKNNNNNNNNQ